MEKLSVTLTMLNKSGEPVKTETREYDAVVMRNYPHLNEDFNSRINNFAGVTNTITDELHATGSK